MMRKRAHSRNSRAFLPSPLASRRDKQADVFAIVATRLPLLACLVPEGFPLRGEVAVAGGDAEEEGVVFFELVGRDEGDGRGLAWRVHFGQDFLWEGLFDSMSDRVLALSKRREDSRVKLFANGERLTGRDPLCLQRPQCRPFLARQSWQCDRTWSTESIGSAMTLARAFVIPWSL